MPFQETSPLAAAVGMAGGWLQGQQAAKQRALQQQQLDKENAMRQAQIALDQKSEAAREAYEQFDMDDRRTASQLHQGIDPKTGKPIMAELPPSLTQLRPNNKGRGGAATEEEQYNHAFSVAAFLNSRGFTDQAKPYFDNAAKLAAQMGREDMFKNDFTKALVLKNLTLAGQLQDIKARGDVEAGLVGSRAAAGEAEHQANRDYDVSHPTYGETHPRPLSLYQGWEIGSKGPMDLLKRANAQSRDTDTWISGTIKSMASQNDAAIKDGKEPPNPNMAGFANGLKRMLSLAKSNPAKLDGYIKQVMNLPTLSDSQKAATVEAMRRAAGTAGLYHQAQQGINQADKIPGISNFVPTAPPALP